MESSMPSDTFKYIYHNVIEEMLCEICKNDNKYCVRDMYEGDKIHIGMWKKFEKYKEDALNNVSSKRLDRHKLASCICGAVVEVKPLEGYKGAAIPKNANEKLAVFIGIAIIKYYMIYDYFYNAKAPLGDSREMREYLKENFKISFPALDENICDTQEYQKNITNALYWSHYWCPSSKKECFRFDIWAYANIFYHLELYNRKKFDEICRKYMEQKRKSI